MMRITAVVEFESGTQTKPVKPWNICEIERRVGKSFHQIVNDNIQHELCLFAWHTFTDGQGDPDAWLRDVLDVVLEVGEKKVDPTKRKRSPG